MGATSASSGVRLIEVTRRRVHWVGWLANAAGSLLGAFCSAGGCLFHLARNPLTKTRPVEVHPGEGARQLRQQSGMRRLQRPRLGRRIG